jgi:5-methyltetrahydrofolate--homocysteine methyltransferase
VKGDVHDIGKNIVGVVLGCNGYDVVDLGVMVPAEAIVEQARLHDVDVIGLSGLITPSLDEMVTVATTLKREGFDLPLLIGGATTSKAHTALRIAPAYGSPTVQVPDASRAVSTVARLLDPARRDAYAAELSLEQEHARQRLAVRETRRTLLSLDEARKARFTCDWSDDLVEAPSFTGPRVVDDVTLSDLVPYIDWTPFFHAWELRGVYPRLLEDDSVGERARELHTDALRMLDRFVRMRLLEPRGVYGFFPAASDGDDIVVFTATDRASELARIATLRQQMKKGAGGTCLALADFVAPRDAGVPDHVGAFAVTSGHGLDEVVARHEADHDDYGAIMAKALADRLAEAFAELLHERARRAWGYGTLEKLTLEELLAERYRGIRPAPGYPACPDHEGKRAIWRLLDVEAAAGMRLTETSAMWPASSVSGWYFAHPNARYFSVGPIDSDQVADYAARLGVSIEEAETRLQSNLAYDPSG